MVQEFPVTMLTVELATSSSNRDGWEALIWEIEFDLMIEVFVSNISSSTKQGIKFSNGYMEPVFEFRNFQPRRYCHYFNPL